MRSAWALGLAAALAGCAVHMPAALAPEPLGPTDYLPIGPVTGQAHSVHFFSWRRYGDDTTEMAVQNAIAGTQGDQVINRVVMRHVMCFPECRWPILTISETSVEGTLVRYNRMPVWEKPQPTPPVKLEVGQPPPAQRLVERMLDLYGQDPKQAADFFATLDEDGRRHVVQFVISAKGTTAAVGWDFKPSKNLGADERRFVEWFVASYTTYKVVGE
jgi:hypothetical protein